MPDSNIEKRVIDAIRETLKDAEGAGSDLRHAEELDETWMEVVGNLDIPHLAHVAIDTVLAGQTAQTIHRVIEENEQLRQSNALLAGHVAATTERMEQAKRDLLAHGWDAAVDQLITTDADDPKAFLDRLKEQNPFRKEL